MGWLFREWRCNRFRRGHERYRPFMWSAPTNGNCIYAVLDMHCPLLSTRPWTVVEKSSWCWCRICCGVRIKSGCGRNAEIIATKQPMLECQLTMSPYASWIFDRCDSLSLSAEMSAAIVQLFNYILHTMHSHIWGETRLAHSKIPNKDANSSELFHSFVLAEQYKARSDDTESHNSIRYYVCQASCIPSIWIDLSARPGLRSRNENKKISRRRSLPNDA